MLRNIRSVFAILIAFTAVAVAAGAMADDTEPSDPCTIATLELIELPTEHAVDEIRVHLADHSPDDGAIDVRVANEYTDRILHLRGQSAQILSFSPAVSADAFDLSIEPVPGAEADACVAKVMLVADGLVVATVTP